MLQTVSRASQFGVPPVTAPPMILFRSLMAGTGLSLALCAATPAFAQDDPVIVVTGSGLEETPAAPAYDTQVIDRDQLVSVPSGRIEDALSAVAGFQQFRRSDSRSANASAQPSPNPLEEAHTSAVLPLMPRSILLLPYVMVCPRPNMPRGGCQQNTACLTQVSHIPRLSRLQQHPTKRTSNGPIPHRPCAKCSGFSRR